MRDDLERVSACLLAWLLTELENFKHMMEVLHAGTYGSPSWTLPTSKQYCISAAVRYAIMLKTLFTDMTAGWTRVIRRKTLVSAVRQARM